MAILWGKGRSVCLPLPEPRVYARPKTETNAGTLIIRIGFWGFLVIIIYYKIPPSPILIIKAPILHTLESRGLGLSASPGLGF